MQPWWLDWTAGLFPVILAVFLLRSFLFEPFKIPSGSMKPTLLVGDLILVNKFHYGVRLPVINKKIVADQRPAARRRDGVPLSRRTRAPTTSSASSACPATRSRSATSGSTSTARPRRSTPAAPSFYDDDTRRYEQEFNEKLGPVQHHILINPQSSPFFGTAESSQFPFRENCRYSAEGVTCKVPPGHYFMMGDNRDNSQDSRYWGFVPDENIVGKAFFVWMNFGDLKRIGSFTGLGPAGGADGAEQFAAVGVNAAFTLFGLLFWAIIVGFAGTDRHAGAADPQRVLHDQADGQQDHHRGRDRARDPRRLRAAEGHRVRDHLDLRQGPERSPRKTTRSSSASPTTRRSNC